MVLILVNYYNPEIDGFTCIYLAYILSKVTDIDIMVLLYKWEQNILW